MAYGVVLVLFCHGRAVADPVLRYAQSFSSVRSIFSLPIVVADREGFFRREGLDFRIVVPIPGGGEAMIAALHVATPFLIQAALAGSDAVAIAAEFNNPVYSLIAQPRIKSFGDLQGKLIAFADDGGSISASMHKLLALHGLRAGDYREKRLEGTPARASCLKRGECEAVPLGQPQDFSALDDGFSLIGRSTEAVPELLYTVTAVRRSWAQAHRDTVVRYVRALGAAFRFIRDPGKRDRVIALIVDFTGASPAAARQTLEYYFEPERRVLPQVGELDLAGLGRVIALMGEAGTLKAPLPAAERFVDAQYFSAAAAK
jgi:ABC-type nitrate/sulfonate/bicarbonate transport system substrate-binding protein